MSARRTNPPRNGEVAGPQGLTEGAHFSSGAVREARWGPSTIPLRGTVPLPVPGRI